MVVGSVGDLNSMVVDNNSRICFEISHPLLEGANGHYSYRVAIRMEVILVFVTGKEINL